MDVLAIWNKINWKQIFMRKPAYLRIKTRVSDQDVSFILKIAQ